MVAVLRTEGLTKHFGAFKAVDGIDLQVDEGDLYGFLGPNGSGKTTSMRMILRLMRPTAGRVTMFGLDVASNFVEVMRKVGSLVELPAYYPYLSAVKNLEVLRLATGGIEPSRIPELLELVGLGPRMYDRVGTYSQGMRQRLGIAMALLPRPRLCFLDEPTNGLDPQGINHIRSVIRDYNAREGTTFVISSHLLHEVEITCTRVGMIKQGRMVFQDRLDRVLEKAVDGLLIRAEPLPKALDVLKAIPGVGEAREEGSGRIRVTCPTEAFGRVNAALTGAGVTVSELVPARRTLEEIFLSQ